MDKLNKTIDAAEMKAGLPVYRMILLGFLAGVFIAFGAEGSNMAAFNLLMGENTYGLGRAFSGVVFAAGLIMVILAGGELFTGNNLMLCGVLDKRIKTSQMLKNWIIVYIANFAGAIFIAALMNYSGLFATSGGMLGVLTVKIGGGKTSLAFGKAVVLGIMCNFLVCIAVWMATGADNTAGKILSILFPIWLFVTSGFEHSVANMYYIPAALFAKGQFGQAAIDAGVSSDVLDSLTWQNFFAGNLLPVTIGNIIGGALFVGAIYYFSYRKKKDD